MELVELLKDNWINLVIIFALSFIGFLYKKRSKDNYFDNIIKYTDILEKTPQPKYQKIYLNNIKKKLLWEKVCFYKSGNIDKERIAISLVNADINNNINLPDLNTLTQYFCIKQNQIIPLKPFMIKEVLFNSFVFFLAFIIILSNISSIFNSTWFISVIIAILTIFIVAIVVFQVSLSPIKRFKTYLLILKDNNFLKRANNELDNIIKTSESIDSNMIEEIIENE